MGEKLVKCKACGKEIAQSAKVCPGCGKKNKKPLWQTLLIVFAVIVVISVIANISGGSKEDGNQTQVTASSGNETTATAKASFIKAGMYKVGSEVAPGEYVVEATANPGYFQIASDSTGEFDSIIVNDNLNKGEFGYIIIQDGDYVQLQNCRMYLSSEKTIQPVDLDKIPSSTYKIGKDLPVGEYKLTVKRQPAYWERSKNPRDSVFGIIANDNIENSAYVKVSEGEYFKIQGIEASLVK
jgi:RNA polymerase subunit RPABC4/transcription elongation factor Spt4